MSTARRYVACRLELARRLIEADRAGDACEVPGCSHDIFLELMHVGRSHAKGGSREADNLALGCSTHHVLLDAGVICFDGWTEDGRPRFVDARGRRMSAAAGRLGPLDGSLDGALPGPAGGVRAPP